MTDDLLDQMIRDADPYRAEALGDLEDARHALLAAIQSRRPHRGHLLRYAAGALATAAVITAVFAVPLVVRGHPDNRRATPAPAASASSPAARPDPVHAAAEANPRLLIDQPGWKVATVYGFGQRDGTITYAKGALRLEVNWYPADQYDFYHADRLDGATAKPVRVGGWPADLLDYGTGHVGFMLTPRDGSFVEMGDGGLAAEEFRRLLPHIVRVDVPTFLAALPQLVVDPAKARAAAAEALSGVPLPPGFDLATLDDFGTNETYQIAALATGRVGCAWIAEWQRAKASGDPAALQRASSALHGSHQWKSLLRIEDQGGWSAIFWGVADSFVAGHPQKGYADAIGCV